MRIRAANAFLRLYPVIAGIAFSCLATGTTFAQGGQKIEFSAPQSVVVVSNLNRLGTKQPGLKQLEEDLSRQFESLNPDSSLGAVVDAPSRPPPSRPTSQSKREKELEDLRKNWVFVNPDDVTQGPTPEKIFGLKEYEKNGEEKKPMSAIEKYYQNQDRKRGGADEQSDNSFASKENDVLHSFPSTDQLDPLDGGMRKSGQMLKGLFNSDLDGRTAPHSTTFSGLPTADLVKVGGLQNGRTIAEQARMDEFKRFLEPRPALPSTEGSLNPQADPTRSLVNPEKSLDPFTSPTKQDSLNPFQNAINPAAAFQPTIFQDVNSRAFGQPAQASPLLPTPPPKAQPPPQNFTFPTRKF